MGWATPWRGVARRSGERGYLSATTPAPFYRARPRGRKYSRKLGRRSEGTTDRERMRERERRRARLKAPWSNRSIYMYTLYANSVATASSNFILTNTLVCIDYSHVAPSPSSFRPLPPSLSIFVAPLPVLTLPPIHRALPHLSRGSTPLPLPYRTCRPPPPPRRPFLIARSRNGVRHRVFPYRRPPPPPPPPPAPAPATATARRPSVHYSRLTSLNRASTSAPFTALLHR